jgi:hypothetical protein
MSVVLKMLAHFQKVLNRLMQNENSLVCAIKILIKNELPIKNSIMLDIKKELG